MTRVYRKRSRKITSRKTVFRKITSRKRSRKITSRKRSRKTVSRKVASCKDDEERNEKTGRCRKKCKDNQERNEKTGRCRTYKSRTPKNITPKNITPKNITPKNITPKNITKILFKKYDYQNPSTNFANKSFYEKGKLYFLTNGANEYLSNIGGGTTGAFDSMGGEKYFLNARKYDKNRNMLEPHPSKNVDVIDNRMINDNDLYYSEIKQDNKYPIVGVFHIKGKNWRWMDKSSQMGATNIKNIRDYYKAVIEIANEVALKSPRNQYILHLSCIPGAIYDGGDATNIGMKKAINDTMNILSSNLEIQVDMDKNEYDMF